jgi:hypothetical protein
LDGKKEEELRIRELLGEDYIGDIFQVSTSRDKNFQAICEYLAKTKPAIQANVFAKVGWSQSYVFNSGSILEYYQYMKCFDMMVDYEKRNDIAFDIVLRSRLDIVVGQPLHLQKFFTEVDTEILEKYGFDVYRRSLANIVSAKTIEENIICKEQRVSFNPANCTDILDYLNNRSLLWVLGQNQIWIGKRHVLEKLYPLIFFYGSFLTDYPFTFNSETQFAEFCQFKGIEILKHSTEIDGHYISSRSANKSIIVDGELNPKIKTGFMWSIIRPDGYPFPYP